MFHNTLAIFEGPEHRLKQRIAEPEPAVFRRYSFVSGEKLF